MTTNDTLAEQSAEAGSVAPARALSKSEATRERIITSAAHVLAERGYAGTKLSDIGRQAGIQAGSLYYHFDDRDDIVDHVLRRGVREIFDTVRNTIADLPDDADDLARLETAVRAHLSVILDATEVASASLRLLGQLPPETQRRYRQAQRGYGEYWHDLITNAQQSGVIRDDLDPMRLRLLIIGQLNWVAEWPKAAKSDRAQVTADAVALLMRGLRPDAALR